MKHSLPKEEKTRSVCGASDLLAAIFGRNADTVRHNLGLPNNIDRRKEEERLKRELKEERSGLVPVECAYCGKLTYRRKNELLYRIDKRGYQRFFCNRVCFGRYAARHYGFIAHPENIPKGRKASHNWKDVWAWRCLGVPVRKIAKEYGYKASTTHVSLTKIRKQLREGKEVPWLE